MENGGNGGGGGNDRPLLHYVVAASEGRDHSGPHTEPLFRDWGSVGGC